MVVNITYGVHSCILTGDATKKTTDHIMGNLDNDYFSSPVLQASHHGAAADGCNDKAWLKKVKPLAMVFSAGLRDDYKHPRCTTIVRAEKVLPETDHYYHIIYSGIGNNEMVSDLPFNGFAVNGYGASATKKDIFGTLTHGTITYRWKTDDELTAPTCSNLATYKRKKICIMQALKKLSCGKLSLEHLKVVNLTGLGINDRKKSDKKNIRTLLKRLRKNAKTLKELFLNDNKLNKPDTITLIVALVKKDRLRVFEMKNNGLTKFQKKLLKKVWNNRGLKL